MILSCTFGLHFRMGSGIQVLKAKAHATAVGVKTNVAAFPFIMRFQGIIAKRLDPWQLRSTSTLTH